MLTFVRSHPIISPSNQAYDRSISPSSSNSRKVTSLSKSSPYQVCITVESSSRDSILHHGFFVHWSLQGPTDVHLIFLLDSSCTYIWLHLKMSLLHTTCRSFIVKGQSLRSNPFKPFSILCFSNLWLLLANSKHL